ncbi:solute carrier family 9B (sodium/hydrogen exchanger), member 1/2 [Aerococcus sp. 150760007-1]|uniref:Cation:proton antiporter n=1 Tax=Aerococcus urinaeequi TaxID=51665 RepID=A0ABR5ZWQ6_9LACT|nr:MULTISPECIES: cation:proton antiporter [Lactobacillales]KAF3299540.1 sodium:proton antiporter [Carnobacterium sp. PL17RED31]KAF3305160.1 sodium:proton antiporter [Carnobacterium sp. PL17GRE32]MBA5746120.1 cation:proton antiporter [Aerococcus urinaeequi]MBA5828904.1 cation:proton antiporter [Aerococcus urinaeequi]MBA5859808.1 cation:proton antiporter [Aerococcus urinaeequi]
MLLSLGFIIVVGYLLGRLLSAMNLPSLIGYIIAGLIMGPSFFNLIDQSTLDISSDLRRIALMIILLRAGLNIDLQDLKKVGRPAILMSFLPATLEIIGTIILAPIFFGMSYLSAAILGAIIAATSPAVVVARMLDLMGKGYGKKKGVPQMILAGSSMDDIFVIIIFTALTALAQTGEFHWLSMLSMPTSIILGIAGGLLVGWLLSLAIEKYQLSGGYPVILTFGMALLFDGIEKAMTGPIGFSALLAVMAMGFMMLRVNPVQAKSVQVGFNNLWQVFEIILFVLVGASMSIESVEDSGLIAVVLIVLLLVFRGLGVLLSVLGTQLNKEEKAFAIFAYIPKATVQAAIGAVPLAMGLPNGQIILTISVVAILVTAPLGAVLIDQTHNRLLRDDR